jgi:pre-mRNA cleavage complex 2 protein Pcf11
MLDVLLAFIVCCVCRAFAILVLTCFQTAPVKKLPALYLLDSVVKNVGTPYTLFFGRNLYSTFMEAYALVDNNVRRKMEEMLKTWKEPVPGSLDTRPVFPVDVTRPIENALIKARTSAQQAHNEYIRNQQQPLRGRPGPSSMPYRETPTPPGMMRQPQYGQMPGPSGNPSQPPPYMQQPYGAPQVCLMHSALCELQLLTYH